MEHLDPVQSEYLNLIHHVTMTDQVKGAIEKPGFVGIFVAICLLVCSKNA